METESQLNRWLGDYVRYRKGHWLRVENWNKGGTPDVNFCLNGIEVWVELKIRVGSGFVEPLKPFQMSWLVQRARAGGRAFVLSCVSGTPLIEVWWGNRAHLLKNKELYHHPANFVEHHSEVAFVLEYLCTSSRPILSATK